MQSVFKNNINFFINKMIAIIIPTYNENRTFLILSKKLSLNYILTSIIFIIDDTKTL